MAILRTSRCVNGIEGPAGCLMVPKDLQVLMVLKRPAVDLRIG